MASFAGAQTVSGVITSDTTWTIGGSPITVTGSVTVNAGKTLTIDPGVVIKFNAGTALYVAGKIVANATQANPIKFTSSAGSPAPGDWNGMEFQATTNVGSVFNYCIVEYAGAGPDASGLFYITGAYSINISNSTFRYNSTNGINARASSPRISQSTFDHNGGFGVFSDLLSNFVVDSCTITNNTTGGVRVSVNASSATITNSVIDTNGIGIFIDNNAFPTVQNNNIRKNATGIQFTGVGSTQPTINGNTIATNTAWGFRNTSTSTVKAEHNYWGSAQGPYHPSSNPTGLGNLVSDYVDFQPWSIQGAPLPVIQITANIASNTTWLASSVYWVKNSIAVNNTFVLTIAAGTIIKFAPGVRLTVNGAIVANGMSDSLIVFTSDKDDGYGGDSNGDGIATGPNPNDWDMLYLSAGQNNSSNLSYCVLKFGGSGSYGNILIQNVNPQLSYLYSANSGNYGLYFTNSSSNVSNSTIGGNGYRGIYMSNTTSTISNSSISGNANIGIWADGTSKLTIRKTTVANNGSNGIHVDGGTGSKATVVLLDSCTVTNNNGWGIYNWAASGPQTFSNSRFSNNTAGGLWTFNLDDTVHITADTVLNNLDDGIVTSRALITNNIITGNRYPIALIGRVNSTYTGNTITGNKFNNALALRINRYEESLSDTLKTQFPAGVTSGTYALVDNNSGQGVLSGQTLVIQPGVIIKMTSGLYFNVYGRLIANGTKASPIVFTSWRDNSYGGKTSATADTNAPAPGDWQYVRVDGAGAVNSVIRNCIFKFGGMNGYGNLWLNSANIISPIDSVVLRRSSNYGSYIGNSLVTFTNCAIDTNGSFGMYIDGSSPRADVSIRNSVIQDNGNIGLYASSNSTYREVTNCTIRRNNGTGIQIGNGTITQVFNGNTIVNNNGHGVYTNSPTVSALNVQFIGNMFSDNSYEGVFSSAARFVDNKFVRNRYPIGVLGHLGNIYTDNNNVDGNRFNGNRFNNAIAVAGSSYAPLSDTLKNAFPDSITSHTYVVIEHIQIAGGATLVIQPGVIVKFQMFPPNYNDPKQFNVYGTMLANGTPANPIIFTSWRDSTVGGKTAGSTEFGLSLGDWDAMYLRNGAGASVIRNCQFKYGGYYGNGTIYYESNLGGLTFSNNLIRRSSTYGIYVSNTALTIDSTTIDSCAHNGIYLGGNTATNLTLRNSRVIANKYYGVFAEGNAKVTLISNSVIANSKYTGLYIQNNSVPLSIVGNTVSNNGDHGMYILGKNDAYDTLLIIAGNKVRNNGLIGIASSRAHLVDDSVTGNRYPYGVIGQISLDGTSNAAGNYYQGGYIAGNKFNNVLITQGTIYGRLGLSFPYTDTSKLVAVRGDALVESGTTLTIAPGTIIKFPKEYGNGRFEVDGVIKSEGTTNKKIVFTSWKDDSYGGDSNADTSTTLPGPGDWDMVYLYGSNNNSSHLLQTIIRYGGSTGNGNLYLYSNNAPVDTSFLSFSSNNGVQMYNSNPLLTGNEIHHNPTGIYLWGSSNPIISKSNFHDNSTYGLNNSTSSTVDARFNYWGDASGPLVNQGSDQNVSGLGNRIGINPGAVLYKPFSTSRSGVLLGDVSSNGSITAFDASLILQYLVSLITLTPTQLTAADVSSDGTVSALDASYILRYVVGIITGFPGLGKHSTEANIASSYEFKPRAGKSADEFELVMHLNGKTPVYGSELKVEFDTKEISFVSLSKSSISDSLTSFSNVIENAVSVAIAGTTPVTEEGDLLILTFKAKNGIKKNWSTALHVSRFVLNETNLTPSVSDVKIDMLILKGIPTQFALSQNYPNPFNPTTNIDYQLPVAGAVSLKVYDILGKEIAELMNQEQKAGYYMLTWNGQDATGKSVASGVYFYRVQVKTNDNQSFAAINRMLLLK
jgi:parallel beta-helix repeat protein